MICSSCGKPHERVGQRYCVGCHNAYMREWRKTNPMSDEQRLKDTARSYANVYLRRGKIQRGNCRDCGGEHAEMHHEDYSMPLKVIWLCRPCHMLLHKSARETIQEMVGA